MGKKSHLAAHAYTLTTRDVETGGLWEFTGQPASPIGETRDLDPMRDPVSGTKVGAGELA